MADQSLDGNDEVGARVEFLPLPLAATLTSPIVFVLVLFAINLGLYWPTLSFPLISDDFQWVQHAHRALHQPGLYFDALGGFFRPVNTWSLAIDLLVWRDNAMGFHLTNLILSGLVALCLTWAARRLGLSTKLAGFVGVLWLVSPFTEEPACSIATRHDSFLFLAWLVLIALWPRKEEKCTFWRGAGIVVATGISMMSKEVWVVLPGIVLVLELYQRQTPLRHAIQTTAKFVAIVGVYVVLHFVFLPGGRDYFVYSFKTMAKVPHQLAAFFYFETIVPIAMPLTWKGVVALLIMIVIVYYAFQSRNVVGIVGAALLFLPMVPTLFVPFLPTRYTTIPFAGFVLLMIASFHHLCSFLSGRWRRVLVLGAGVIAALVVVVGAITVGRDLEDFSRVAKAHEQLLAEMRKVVNDLPIDRPFAVIRQETDQPLRDVALSVRGLPKILYPRHQDPYALADTAAAFEWVAMASRELVVDRIDDGATRFANTTGAILVHYSGRFEWQGQDIPYLGMQVGRLTERGVRVQFLQAKLIR